MKAESCFELGYLTKPHGLSGEMQAILDSETPEYYENMESVFVELNKRLVPFFIESISISGKKAIIKFEDIKSPDEAAEFAGKKLYLPLDLLPALEEDQFYYHEIINYNVIDNKQGPLGKGESVVENPGHDLIIMQYLDREVIIPLIDDIVYKVDHDNSTILVDLPNGLLELYMED